MGRQIVKQPNGLYAVWSSIVDSVIVYDATPDEIIEFYQLEEMKRLRDGVLEAIAALERGEKPSGQFTKSWEDCLHWIEVVHGKDDETLAELRKIKAEQQ